MRVLVGKVKDRNRSDPDILISCRDFLDAQLLTSLYHEHAVGLRRLAFGVLRDREAADDVVQTAFAKAVDSAGDIEPAALKSWLYRVAFHEAVTWKRRSDVAQRVTRELSQQGVQIKNAVPDDVLVRGEIVGQVRDAIADLSAKEQEVVRARVYDEKTFAEIAAEMGLPLGTVLTRMRRALEKIRRKLKYDE